MHVRCSCGYFALFYLCGTHEGLAVDGTVLMALGKRWLPLLSELAMKHPSIAEEEQCWSAIFAKINRGTESCTRIKSRGDNYVNTEFSIRLRNTS